MGDDSVSGYHPITAIPMPFTLRLYLEGAGWDHERSVLKRQEPKVLVCNLPVIEVIPIEASKLRLGGTFRTPVYVTQSRRAANGVGMAFEADLATDELADAARLIVAANVAKVQLGVLRQVAAVKAVPPAVAAKAQKTARDLPFYTKAAVQLAVEDTTEAVETTLGNLLAAPEKLVKELAAEVEGQLNAVQATSRDALAKARSVRDDISAN